MQDPKPHEIQLFFNCKRCFEELPMGESMREFSRINVGYTGDGRVRIECVRHDMLITYLDPIHREEEDECPTN